MIQFEKILERDVDFLMMRIFAEQPSVMTLFLEKAGLQGAVPIEITHSKTDPSLGESDVTVVLERDGVRHGLLIEDKIDAIAMPDQYERYLKRGQLGQIRHEYESYTILMVAPAAYIAKDAEASKYPIKITYEEILEKLEQHHAEFDASIIRRALQCAARPYVVQEVPQITQFWEQFYQYVWASAHDAEMFPVKGAKGSRSAWFQFKTPLRGTAIYFKAPTGTVDLEFTGKLSQGTTIKDDLGPLLTRDMHWVEAGKSLILRIRVESVDVRQSFEGQHAAIEKALDAVDRIDQVCVQLSDRGYTLE